MKVIMWLTETNTHLNYFAISYSSCTQNLKKSDTIIDSKLSVKYQVSIMVFLINFFFLNNILHYMFTAITDR